MAIIDVRNLSFAYDGSARPVFSDVSFRMDTDWKLGFCGRNGRGKTTFLRLLCGELEYSGSITASVAFEYFPPRVENQDAAAGEVMARLAPEAELWALQREAARLALDEEALARPFCELSDGERTKALLAALFLRSGAFPLIDEPTNHLDMAGREVVARYLREKPGFILVSHDRRFLDDCVDHVLSINKENIEIARGNFSQWAAQKALRDESELARNRDLLGEIDRLKKSARQRGEWAGRAEKEKKGAGDKGFMGAKAARMMKKSKIIERRAEKSIDEKSRLLRDVETAFPLELKTQAVRARRLVELDDVAVGYGGREVLRGLSLRVEPGERLALLGGNGSGKSSALRLICEGLKPLRGRVSVAGEIVVSYVPQDASFLCGPLADYAESRGADMTLLFSMLNKLDFSRDLFGRDMRGYSAGQKKKALLALSLCERAGLYVWDEPLNYVDVISRMQIEDLILEYGPSMIFVEHDREFCERVATRTMRLG